MRYRITILLGVLLILAIVCGIFLRMRPVIKLQNLTDSAGNTYTVVYEKRYFWSGKVMKIYEARIGDSIIQITVWAHP